VAYRLGRLTVRDPEAGLVEPVGDGFAAAGEPVTLAVEPNVQRWLAMSPEEAGEARRIAEAYRSAVSAAYTTGEWRPPHRHPGAQRARVAADAALAALLGEARGRRLERLSRRVRGADALLDPEVAASLGLSPEQRQALLAAMDENESARRRLFAEIAPARLHTEADLQERGARYEEAGAERLLALLTPDQREAFETLRSEPAER
jgi:hypothetical protein